jgi:hypothetical protein
MYRPWHKAGAQVLTNTDSGLIATNNGTLNINGSLHRSRDFRKRIILERDRLGPLFADIPGQWGTIWLFNGSANNTH